VFGRLQWVRRYPMRYPQRTWRRRTARRWDEPRRPSSHARETLLPPPEARVWIFSADALGPRSALGDLARIGCFRSWGKQEPDAGQTRVLLLVPSKSARGVCRRARFRARRSRASRLAGCAYDPGVFAWYRNAVLQRPQLVTRDCGQSQACAGPLSPPRSRGTRGQHPGSEMGRPCTSRRSGPCSGSPRRGVSR
jgi:hypothetical protein